MPPRLRGKWALGITPRNFTWFMKDKLAVCERPSGYGDNHRRVRRQEEIIWLRENGFGCVVSIIPATHNLHNYDELGMPYLHRPFTGTDDLGMWLKAFYTEINMLLEGNTNCTSPKPRASSSASWVATSAGAAWSTILPRSSTSPNASPSASSIRLHARSS